MEVDYLLIQTENISKGEKQDLLIWNNLIPESSDKI